MSLLSNIHQGASTMKAPKHSQVNSSKVARSASQFPILQHLFQPKAAAFLLCASMGLLLPACSSGSYYPGSGSISPTSYHPTNKTLNNAQAQELAQLKAQNQNLLAQLTQIRQQVGSNTYLSLEIDRMLKHAQRVNSLSPSLGDLANAIHIMDMQRKWLDALNNYARANDSRVFELLGSVNQLVGVITQLADRIRIENPDVAAQPSGDLEYNSPTPNQEEGHSPASTNQGHDMQPLGANPDAANPGHSAPNGGEPDAADPGHPAPNSGEPDAANPQMTAAGHSGGEHEATDPQPSNEVHEAPVQ
jgi:hypothetical protein